MDRQVACFRGAGGKKNAEHNLPDAPHFRFQVIGLHDVVRSDICHAHAVGGADQQGIFREKIVIDFFAGKIVQSLRGGLENRESGGFVERSAQFAELAHRSAGDVFTRVKIHAFAFSGLIDRHDDRVRGFGFGAGIREEPVDRVRVCGQRGI